MVPTIEPVTSHEQTLQRTTLAPWQHTLFLIIVLGLWAVYGALHARLAASQMPLLLRYLSSIMMQWLLVGSTLAGVYQRRAFVFHILGLPSTRAVAKDVAIGIVIYLTGTLAMVLIRLFLKATPLHVSWSHDAVRAILPSTLSEFALWIPVAITAGFCEEFVFRGYLQRQITEFSGSVIAGMALPTLLFGALHIYQGVGNAILITVLGLTYALCVARLGSLRGVMIAHALQDVLGGLIHFLRGV